MSFIHNVGGYYFSLFKGGKKKFPSNNKKNSKNIKNEILVIIFQCREVSTTQKGSPLKYCQKTLKK